ncbi:MAG: response regulator [bacterium]|nr:response regulator [bacterium]
MDQDQAKNEKILVVEDNEDILNLLLRMLKDKGYRVVAAESGDEALRMVEEEKPHLVLLDLTLPKVNGYDVCRMLKASENTRYIPVIIVTCKSSTEEKIMGLELGADDYIVKPFCREEVLARIKSLLKLRNLHYRLIQTEKLATLAQVAVSVNHEINNPLCAISANAEVIKMMLTKQIDPAKMNAKLDAILGEVDRIKGVIDKLSRATKVVSMEYISGIQMLDINQSSEPIKDDEKKE